MCENHAHHHGAHAHPVKPVISLRGTHATPVFAVCGKGGVGKTAVAALLAHELMHHGHAPLLLIDADPAGGLVSTLGERTVRTLADVRTQVLESARAAGAPERAALADQADYLVLEALAERSEYSLLALGHSKEKGCYCPIHQLLRESIGALMAGFAAVIVDAEAGLEQIHRQVTERAVTIVVDDGSLRSRETVAAIAAMRKGSELLLVGNRGPAQDGAPIPGVRYLGAVPEDADVRQFDRDGRSLWGLPESNPARRAVAEIAARLPGLQRLQPGVRS